jgi:hypothetical protein
VPASAVLAVIALWKLDAAPPTNPSWGEWLLAAWSAIGRPATGTLAGFMLYGLAYGGVTLFTRAAGYFGYAPQLDPSKAGFYSSVWMVAIVLMGSATEGALTAHQG